MPAAPAQREVTEREWRDRPGRLADANRTGARWHGAVDEYGVPSQRA